MSKFTEKLQKYWQHFKDIMFGMMLYDAVLMFRRQRADMEHLFVLISFGDLIGIPILPPYYNLRLLPYIVPMINKWRRRMLRERDLTELATE